ncbi:ABC transporter ATP-binding protein [Mediterranea massiliensis]|jgi:ABC-2 type transport system ATP-binding protein|uniref:ABC transporter ATP-binding protein n=1 Tax=Mediterranea massiliensis TaxID=1841865 RepID=UPI0025A465D1|nr:ABC transporter ATP-binding protein [Mediterranea massiliensis]MDM8338797.1 ABC transporter ATP-binding protein [Mediterranea massiliensis]
MLQAIDLTKRYEDGHLALDALNLEVQAGEIFFLLGANGAGKTTTLNLFLGFVQPTSGDARVDGLSVTQEPREVKRRLAYIAENVMLYADLTARENLQFFARLGGRKASREECYNLMRTVGLREADFEKRMGTFSKGMRQKVGLACVLQKDAPNILMDEPTTGLDPKSAAELMDTLLRLRSEGKSLLVCTHDLFRARDVADRIGIMKEGRLVMVRRREEFAGEDLEKIYLDYMEETRR